MIEYGFFGIDLPQRVELKFRSYVGAGRIPPGRPLAELFFRSIFVDLTPQLRQAVAFRLKLTEPKHIWVRQIQLSNSFSLTFIGQANRIEEICGYRALRQMAKAWLHRCKELGSITSPPQGAQFHSIFKYKKRSKIQGGLIRQERCPLDRWKKK